MTREDCVIIGQAVKILIFLIIVFAVSHLFLLPGEAKIVFIPDDVKIEENAARETLVHNLSREEIYKSLSLYVIDGFIYLEMEKPFEIIKLNLKGKTVKHAGRRGQGPGELIWISGIREFKENT